MDDEPSRIATEDEWPDRRKANPDVVAAQAAVVEAAYKLEEVAAMLRRHFAFLASVAIVALVVGFLLIYGVLSVRNAQHEVRTLAERTETQTVKNEVEVLRHRVMEREGHRKLCAVALGASREPGLADRICRPVLGDDFPDLAAELAIAERRLSRIKEDNG